MNHRFFLLVGFGALGLSGVLGVACSSNPTTGCDGGSCGDDGGDAQPQDATNPPKDGGDGGVVVQKCPTYPVQGACDIVAQDCPNSDECVVANADGGPATECVTPSTGSIPKGGKCSTTSSCVPGAECIQGRCAPHCCDMDDTPCGASVPEGYLGTCNINLVDSKQKIIGHVCAYSADCTPFGLHPCPMGSTCLVQDMSGKATCSEIYMAPGKAEGQPCSAANECQDGMMCVSGSDGGFVCKYICYKGNGPFDAGVAKMDAGLGGCPKTKTCGGGLQNAPQWLGLCN